MNFKLIVVVVIVVLMNKTSGNTDLSKLMPNIQEEWFKYLADPNRAAFRSEECNKQVDAITSSLMQMEDWALQMFDASSKLQSGIFQGNFIDFGDFSQCLKVRHISQELGLIKGQHCLVFSDVDLVEVMKRLMGMLEIIGGLPSASDNLNKQLNHAHQIINDVADLSRKHEIIANVARSFDGMKIEERDETKVILPLGFATCLPAVCSPDEVKEVMNDFLGKLINSTVKDNYDQAVFCNADEPVELLGEDIACIIVFSFIGLLLILSTCYDVIKHHILKESSPAKPLFLAFSVWSNGAKLFAVNAVDNKSKRETLHCIHGLRALSMIWVVYCHRFMIAMPVPMKNKIDSGAWVVEYSSLIVTAGTVAVDTFFVLGGLLLSYIFLKTVTKTGKFNVPMFYIHRYLRLTPPLAAMIFFQATLLSYFGSGPYWKSNVVNAIVEKCKTSWWPAFLYVQNYVKADDMCHGPSWYLAVDMQLFVLSPLILVPLWKWAKAGVALGVTLIVASVPILFAVTYVNEYTGAPFSLNGDTTQMKRLYWPAYTRFGPWLLGVMLGYLMHIYRNTEIKLNWLTVAVGWLASISLFLTVLYGVHPFLKTYDQQDLLAGAFYQAFSRITWSLSICWIIFACTYGYGGPVNWFLSMPFWQPISRLSFCLYLTHYPLQIALQNAMKQPEIFSTFNMIYKFWGDFGIALTLSIVWCLAFESPITVLEKVLFHSKEKPVLPTEQKEIEDENLVTSYSTRAVDIENGSNDGELLVPGSLNNGYVEDDKS